MSRNHRPTFLSLCYAFLPLFLVLGMAALAMMRWGR